MRLRRAISRYVAMKRSMGISYKTGERLLRSLCGAGIVQLRSVTRRQVLDFLDRAKTSDVTWLVKYRMLRAFFEYWMARGELLELPMPQPRTVHRRRRFVPYIYSVADVRQLLYGVRFKRPARVREIDPVTLRTVFLFLYGTGARVAETLALKQNDVDLSKGTVSFHRLASHRTRTIPIGASLRRWLQDYVDSSNQAACGDAPFFMRNDGQPINAHALDRHLQSLRSELSISRRDGTGDLPKLRDLRHTFAVHCLRVWLSEGKDLRNMLPILAAYLGHVSLSSTEAYLSVTPERFLKQIAELSPHGNPKRPSAKNGDSGQPIATGLALLGLLEYLHEGHRVTHAR